jgi:phage replication O-like protein O
MAVVSIIKSFDDDSYTFTKTPNDLSDHWLPFLKEGELKVLVVIMRKTIGYGKKVDWISLSQLEKFTGLARKTILDSVESLLSKGLIIKNLIGKKGSQKTYYEVVTDWKPPRESIDFKREEVQIVPSQDQVQIVPTKNDLNQVQVIHELGTICNLQKKTNKRKETTTTEPVEKTTIEPKASESVVVSSTSKKQTTKQEQPSKSYDLLQSLNITPAKKSEICKAHTEEEIQKVLDYITSPDFKPIKSLEHEFFNFLKFPEQIPAFLMPEDIETNKNNAHKIEQYFESKVGRIHVGPNYLEFYSDGQASIVTIIKFDENAFVDKVNAALKKYRFRRKT